MEIIDYLRIARRRLWVVVLVPLLAGALVLAAMLRQPTLYSSAAVVGAPALVGGSTSNQYNGAQGVLQYVSAFQSAATSAVVLQKVASQFDLTSNYVNNHLVVSAVGTSSIMHVTFATRDKAVADKVARSVATQTLGYLFGTQVTLTEHEVARAQSDLDAVNAELAEIGEAAHTVAPDRLYDAQQQQVLALQQEFVHQRAAGNTSGAAAAAAQSASLQRSIAALSPHVTKYLATANRRDAAQAVLTTVRQQLAGARYQLEAADPAAVITMTATHPVNEVPLILQKVLPAIGGGLFLAVLLVVALELLSRRRSAEIVSVPVDRSLEDDLLSPASDLESVDGQLVVPPWPYARTAAELRSRSVR